MFNTYHNYRTFAENNKTSPQEYGCMDLCIILSTISADDHITLTYQYGGQYGCSLMFIYNGISHNSRVLNYYMFINLYSQNLYLQILYTDYVQLFSKL